MELTTPSIGSEQEVIADLERRMSQLEETVLEAYPILCRIYRGIAFSKLSPETFAAPYSTYEMTIPHTKLSVTFVTTPPLLVIGTPPSHASVALQWKNVLEIQFPGDTKFISFRYGGDTGTVEWFGNDGAGHMLSQLPALTDTLRTRRFHLAKHKGIRGIKITSSGEMFLTNLAIGISQPRRSSP